MDYKAAESARRLDRSIADARGPRFVCLGRSLLAGREAGRVGVGGQDSQALGLGDRSGPQHARGPHPVSQRRDLLAGW